VNNVTVSKVHWTRWLDDKGAWAPFWLGLAITTICLIFRCMFDGFYLNTSGLPEGYNPLWRSGTWWAELINAILLGYIPAALIIARRGIGRDLKQLSSWLPPSETEHDGILIAATAPSRLLGRTFMFSGFIGGIMLVLNDPSILMGTELSLSNPAFTWPLFRIPVFSWLFVALIISDLRATHAYFYVGRNLVAVDLLNVESLSPFSQRGLRSALTWVIFSIIFSLFWLGEDIASRINFSLLLVLLTMATVAFIVPLIGAHRNIRSVKQLELNHLRQEIRVERKLTIERAADDKLASPRLANLIAYYQLVNQAREWPIDAANLLKFFVYLIIGLASWLGGAIVERLLEITLGA
jgi:hypothetical protein